jgi:cytochrome oxidase assembly protein ShyY1
MCDLEPLLRRACCSVSVADVGLRRVSVEGELDYGREVRVGPRPPPKGTPERLTPAAGNNGSVVVTPLVRGGGRSDVLVIRGWWPSDAYPAPLDGEEAAQPGTHRSARVRVTGVLRDGENVSGLLPFAWL